MAEKYKAIYKCRLCGEEFEGTTGKPITESSLTSAYISILNSEDNFCIDGRIGRRYQTHRCKDGSFGFSEFQGIKKINNEVLG